MLECCLDILSTSHQSKSLAVYSRDMLTGPIRQYESILLTIRNNTFAPDATRSGLMKNALQEPPVIKIEDTDSEFELPKFNAADSRFGLESPEIEELQAPLDEEHQADHDESLDMADSSWDFLENKNTEIDDHMLLSELKKTPASVEVPASTSSDDSDSDSSD